MAGSRMPNRKFVREGSVGVGMGVVSASGAPSCAPFMNTIRSTGEGGDRQSMIAFRSGVRLVRQRPGSAEALLESIRWRSDHSETVSSGSGIKPSRQARSMSSAPS